MQYQKLNKASPRFDAASDTFFALRALLNTTLLNWRWRHYCYDAKCVPKCVLQDGWTIPEDNLTWSGATLHLTSQFEPAVAPHRRVSSSINSRAHRPLVNTNERWAFVIIDICFQSCCWFAVSASSTLVWPILLRSVIRWARDRDRIRRRLIASQTF